jgi:Mce-associated membrane protein
VADKTSGITDSGDTAGPVDKTAGETSTATVDTADETPETNTAADETAAETDATASDISEASGTADQTSEASGTADQTSEASGTADQTSEASGTADQTSEASGTADQTSEAAGTGSGAGRIRVAAIALGAATVVLGAFGVWATLEAHSLRADAAPQNIAVTDGAATSAVNRQIVSAVDKVFSYSYADTAATRQAAQGLLTGPAIHQYDTYFALVAKDAPSQKLVVTTRVTNSGVELLAGNQARVLVFANQQDTRAGTSQTSYAGALFAVTAVRQGSRWKIENIDTFNGQ